MPSAEKNSTHYFEPIILVIFWLILFGSPLLFGNFPNGLNAEQVFKMWHLHFPLFLAFLINRFVLLPYLFFDLGRGWYMLAVAGLIGSLTLLNQAVPPPGQPRPNLEREQRPWPPRPPAELHQPPQQHPAPFPRTVVFSFFCLMVIGLDTGLKLSTKLSEKERENDQLEKESVSNQLAFLRNQVSPHFFMNTLNNIHSLIDIDTHEAKASVIKLSKLMRHLLYDSEAGYLPLGKEIEFIESYVELMRLRYSNKVKITLKSPGQVPDRQIPPLLFTSLLENAFKYGVSYDKPSYIRIGLDCPDDHSLRFRVSNSNHQKPADKEASGIGLENTRKRLELLFGENHTFDIRQTTDEFTVNLILPL